MSQITYSKQGNYRLPNLRMPQQETIMGKYAHLRESFLKKNKKVLFTTLLTSGKLTEHLNEIQTAATARMEELTTQLLRQENYVTHKHWILGTNSACQGNIPCTL